MDTFSKFSDLKNQIEEQTRKEELIDVFQYLIIQSRKFPDKYHKGTIKYDDGDIDIIVMFTPKRQE